MERRQDAILGLVFAALGLFAAYEATAYSGASGAYPLTLGLTIAVLGLTVFVRALLRSGDAARPLVRHPMRLAAAVGAAAAYLLMVPALGFYTASAALVAALPPLLGFRRPVYALVATAVFIGMVWLVFSAVLEKPLPSEIWSRRG